MLGEVKRGPIVLLCAVISVVLNADSQAVAQVVSTTGLLDWFDPDAGVTTDVNGNIEIWTNQANGGRSVTTPSTATSVVAGPGGSMIRFDAPNNGGQLSYPSAGTAAYADGYTVFTVVRINVPTTDWNSFPRLWRGANDGNALFMRTNGTLEVKSNGAARPASSFTAAYTIGDPTADPATLGEVAILAARVTPTSQELLFNGDVVSSTASQLSYAVDNATIQIGNSVKADMGDVLVYDSTATLTGINETGLTLAQKYGVGWTVAGGSPTVTSNLTVPVIVDGGGLVIDQNGSLAGPVTVNAGSIRFSGNAATVGTNLWRLGVGTSNSGVAYVDTTGTISVAGNSAIGTNNSRGALVQTAGTVSLASGYFGLGQTSGYGYHNVSGGTFSALTTSSGNYIAAMGSGGVGVLDIDGGTFELARFLVGSDNANAFGQVNVTAGLLDANPGGTRNGTIMVANDGSGRFNVGTLAGGNGLVVVGGSPIRLVFQDSSAAASASGYLNLNSGTIRFDNASGGIQGSSSGDLAADRDMDLSLNGGTLLANVANVSLIRGGANAPKRTMLFNGGVTVDTQGNDTSLDAPVIATTGSGFYRTTAFTATPTGEPGAGYVGPPVVSVSGGSGTGIQLNALVDTAGGTITGFVVTNPGQDYQIGDTLSLTLSGNAGSTLAAAYEYTLQESDLAANGTGVFRKEGAGTLTLSAANTFTGETRISAGTLKLAATGSLLSSLITIESGASFDTSEVAGFQLAPGQSLGGSGTFAGSLLIDAGAGLVFDPGNPLLVSSGTVTFGTGFGIDDIVGLDGANISEGLYTLINGTVDLTGVDNVGFANRMSIGGGKQAYFQQGSLELVVVPEPGAMTLAAAAVAGWLGFRFGRRRWRG